MRRSFAGDGRKRFSRNQALNTRQRKLSGRGFPLPIRGFIRRGAGSPIVAVVDASCIQESESGSAERAELW